MSILRIAAGRPSKGTHGRGGGRFDCPGAVRFTTEQGDGLGRPGRLAIELHVRDGEAIRVRVGGRTVTVLEGALRLG